MTVLETFFSGMAENWPYWLVSFVLIVAAVIDGIQLKVPNWLTFPMIISGWAFSAMAYGMAGEGWYVGLGWSLAGTAVGLSLLLPAYSVGGMGAGDVKLMAMLGVWLGPLALMPILFAASISGASLGILAILAAQGQNAGKQAAQLPFGCFLTPMAFIWLFFAPQLLSAAQ